MTLIHAALAFSVLALLLSSCALVVAFTKSVPWSWSK